MRDADKREFVDLLTEIADYYDRKLTPGAIAIYWRGLADLSLEVVRAACNAHLQDPKAGAYMPKVADLLRLVESAGGADGHPGPDEAWAIASAARDEGGSVVWTQQISDAFFAAAMPLLDAGDPIAARKAFQERYTHEIDAARRAGTPARWTPSLGTDPQRRTRAIEAAVRDGRLEAQYAQRLLPHSEAVSPTAIQAIADASAGRKDVAGHIAALRKLLTGAR